MACGLYIHIPFCIKKCAYCDFVSIVAPDKTHSLYFDALKKELCKYYGANIDTIFIGGGTPSCVEAKYIYDTLKFIFKNMNVSPDAEITIETNPGTLTKQKLDIYKGCGINRISLGVQSMQDDELCSLGRIHNSIQAEDAVKLIKASGFSNFNLDIMLATPHQTLKSLGDTLDKAVALSPSHISAYSLIVEEGTKFYEMAQNDELCVADEDIEREMYEYATDFLRKNGYIQYEISNFAKEGFECRHNLKYWKCLPYIGVGVAAHSFYDNKRYENTNDINEYIDMINKSGSAKTSEQVLNNDELVSEYIIMALRLSRGIELDDFYKRFGFDFVKKYKPIIDKYEKGGFLEHTENCIRFTKRGINVSNVILCEFI